VSGKNSTPPEPSSESPRPEGEKAATHKAGVAQASASPITEAQLLSFVCTSTCTSTRVRSTGCKSSNLACETYITLTLYCTSTIPPYYPS